MHYTKEGIVEVREDIFNQLREENSLLTQENVELRNKLELTIRLCVAWEKAATENEKLLREEKSEYKTAAETEIKVENWREKRIAELEEENKRLRKGIDIRLDSMGVKYIMTEEGDYFAKSDFKITE